MAVYPLNTAGVVPSAGDFAPEDSMCWELICGSKLQSDVSPATLYHCASTYPHLMGRPQVGCTPVPTVEVIKASYEDSPLPEVPNALVRAMRPSPDKVCIEPATGDAVGSGAGSGAGIAGGLAGIPGWVWVAGIAALVMMSGKGNG